MNEVERKAAEHDYSIKAFDYASNPTGSRDWTLFLMGWQAALEWRDSQVGELVAYISQDELNVLISGKAGNHIHVGLDTREAWPQGSDESVPYDWLVGLYTSPPTAQINQQLVEALELLINNPFREGTHSSNRIVEIAKAALTAAKSGETK